MSFFAYIPNDYTSLNIARVICIIFLLIVTSGWRPRITGIIHWYISYSFVSSSMTIDGGDSVASVITLLLIPLTLTDNRKWHWTNQTNNNLKNNNQKIIALVTLNTIRVQVAILYFHSVVAKLGVEDWKNGTAVWYYMQDSMLGLNPLLFKMFQGVLASPLVVIPTWGTLILQTILFSALFAPKKYWNIFLVLAILMHEVFAIILGLMSFSLVMIGLLILYLRPTEQSFNLKKIKIYIKDHILTITSTIKGGEFKTKQGIAEKVSDLNTK